MAKHMLPVEHVFRKNVLRLFGLSILAYAGYCLTIAGEYVLADPIHDIDNWYHHLDLEQTLELYAVSAFAISLLLTLVATVPVHRSSHRFFNSNEGGSDDTSDANDPYGDGFMFPSIPSK